MKNKIIVTIYEKTGELAKEVKEAIQKNYHGSDDDYEVVNFFSLKDMEEYVRDPKIKRIELLIIDTINNNIDECRDIKEAVKNGSKIKNMVFFTEHAGFFEEARGLKSLGILSSDNLSMRFSRWIEDIKAKMNEHIYFFLGTKREEVIIDINMITYMEACKDYVKIHMIDGTCKILYVTMKYLEEELMNTTIDRIHRSYFVNIEQARCEHGKVSVLYDGIFLPIGRNYKNKRESKAIAV